MYVFVLLKFAEFKLVLDQQGTNDEDFFFIYKFELLRQENNINISKSKVMQNSYILNVKFWE